MAYVVGEPLPQRMTAPDMCKAFDLKRSRFYELVKAGRFDRFALPFKVGETMAWSGVLVARYFAGESIPKRSRTRAA